MKSKSLFKTIFEKESNIIKSDIEQRILGCFKENSLFECKNIVNAVTGEVKQKTDPRDIITPELVAFLNKIDLEGGILALGINAKDKIPTKILGIDESLIKSEGRLRDWIINDISSIPRFLDHPTIEIEKVNLQEHKNVFLIEIHPQDANVVYYSTRDGCAYKREADETKKIPLDETFRLVEEKRIAKVFVTLENLGFKEQEGIIQGDVKVVYKNLGARPASNGSCLFLFKTSEQDKCEITYPVSNILDITDINTCFKCFQREFTKMLYPNRPVVDGVIKFKFRQSAIITLSIEFDEEKGRSKQIFSINKDGVKEVSKIFKSYI